MSNVWMKHIKPYSKGRDVQRGSGSFNDSTIKLLKAIDMIPKTSSENARISDVLDPITKYSKRKWQTKGEGKKKQKGKGMFDFLTKNSLATAQTVEKALKKATDMKKMYDIINKF